MNVPLSILDLAPISASDWNYDRAAHLLAHAGFSGTPAEIRADANVQAAYLGEELIVDAWIGDADPAAGRPVDGDTLFPIFSVTKGFTTAAIHLQAERGLSLADYDALVQLAVADALFTGIEEDRFLILLGNEVKADLPLSQLSSSAPEYDRPWAESPAPPPLHSATEAPGTCSGPAWPRSCCPIKPGPSH